MDDLQFHYMTLNIREGFSFTKTNGLLHSYGFLQDNAIGEIRTLRLQGTVLPRGALRRN